jgi:hypothetical protein
MQVVQVNWTLLGKGHQKLCVRYVRSVFSKTPTSTFDKNWLFFTQYSGINMCETRFRNYITYSVMTH